MKNVKLRYYYYYYYRKKDRFDFYGEYKYGNRRGSKISYSSVDIK